MLLTVSRGPALHCCPLRSCNRASLLTAQPLLFSTDECKELSSSALLIALA